MNKLKILILNFWPPHDRKYLGGRFWCRRNLSGERPCIKCKKQTKCYLEVNYYVIYIIFNKILAHLWKIWNFLIQEIPGRKSAWLGSRRSRILIWNLQKMSDTQFDINCALIYIFTESSRAPWSRIGPRFQMNTIW